MSILQHVLFVFWGESTLFGTHSGGSAFLCTGPSPGAVVLASGLWLPVSTFRTHSSLRPCEPTSSPGAWAHQW